MKVHKFPFTIAYADTDAEGIVYHARYLEIAERARMNWLRGHVVVGDDIGFVVRELNIKYLQPLHAADDIVVETRMTDVGSAIVRI
ncbi:MAG: thioesterase family protein, partial [Alphaproteobacteria bacterium]|nr:thioesterase family protein [Alphaproteobacteria bacterium]